MSDTITIGKAAATLTQYRAVKITAAFTVNAITNSNTERPVGVLQNDPIADEGAEIAEYGKIGRCELGGTVAAGDKLACGTGNNGTLVTDVEVADGSAVDLHHIGIALQAGDSGEVIYFLALAPQFIGKE